MSPSRKIYGTDIYYEAYGRGETVMYLQSALGGLNPGAYYFAGRMSANYRVIIWDTPGSGRSGADIRDVPGEYHLDCEYIKGLLDELGEECVHIAGCSGGGEMGLLFASVYPERVKSLAMYRPADTTTAPEREITKARYYDIADAADISMVEAFRFSENPPGTRFGNVSRWLSLLGQPDRERLMSMDNRKFAAVMRRWGDCMSAPGFYRAHLTDEELGRLTFPVLICVCPDDFHPACLGEELHRLLPRSELASAGGHRSEEDMYNDRIDENLFGGFTGFVDMYSDFMGRLSGRGVKL